MSTMTTILSGVALIFAIMSLFVPFFIYRIRCESIESTKLMRVSVAALKSIRTELARQGLTEVGLTAQGFRKIKYVCTVKRNSFSGINTAVVLKAGSIVNILDTKDGWCSVATHDEPDTPIGWVEEENLEVL